MNIRGSISDCGQPCDCVRSFFPPQSIRGPSSDHEQHKIRNQIHGQPLPHRRGDHVGLRAHMFMSMLSIKSDQISCSTLLLTSNSFHAVAVSRIALRISNPSLASLALASRACLPLLACFPFVIAGFEYISDLSVSISFEFEAFSIRARVRSA